MVAVDSLADVNDSDRDGYRVLVLTDNELTRRGLNDMLGSLTEFTAVETLVAIHPDHVPFGEHGPVDILVIACDDLNGKEVNWAANTAARYGIKILVLIERGVDCLDTVIQFPGNGFLIRDNVTEGALASALTQIVSGEVPMPAMLTKRLLERARGGVPPERPVAPELTPHEHETLVLLAGGLSDKQIARKLLISQHGVKRLVANTLAKLNCSNRTLAIREGLLSDISGEEYGEVLFSLFEKSGIGLAVLDPALRVLAINDVFSRQCGCPPEAVKDRSFLGLLDLDLRPGLLRQLRRMVQGGHRGTARHCLRAHFEQTGIGGHLTVLPVGDGHGKVRMIVVQFAPERSQESVPAVRSQRRVTALAARILEGVAAGDSTVRLATKLFLSRQGVEYHVSILLRQFKVPNRTALAAKAYSMGMFSAGYWPPKVLPEYIRDAPCPGLNRMGPAPSTAAQHP